MIAGPERSRRRDREAVLLLLLGVFATGSAMAGPVVHSVWGVPQDGQRLTIMGQGFGVHGLDIAWAGGPDGFIETSADGTLMRDVAGPWDETLASDVTRPRISSVRAFSGSQSIESHVDYSIPASWQSGFEYENPERFDEIYATWWTYFEPLSGNTGNCTGPQWKIWRLNDGPPLTRVNDHPGEIMLGSNYLLDPPDGESCTPHKTQMRIQINAANPACWETSEDCTTGRCACYGWAYPSGEAVERYRSVETDDTFHWARWEVYARRSEVDVKDGTLQLWLTVDGQPTATLADWRENICTHRDLTHDPEGKPPWGITDTPRSWKYVIWQNYYGNQIEGTPAEAHWWIDDVYLQFGNGKARVELGDAPDWESCRRRVVLRPTVWNDTSIQVEMNRAAFAPEDRVYLYVVDASGRISNGLPLTVR